jgi:endoglucanase
MIRRRALASGAALALLAAGCAAADPAAPLCTSGSVACRTRATADVIGGVWSGWFRNEWRAYAASFVSEDGRIIDNGNGDVSHSEGQGYGLLLAAYAKDAELFDRIWSWTRMRLQTRSDKLLSWRWDQKKGAITDLNNATDGDMLVAWALARGAKIFDRPDYAVASREIAEAIGDHALVETPFGPALLPGASGFGAEVQPDGPIVNPSYWIYPAFAALAEIDPKHDWRAVQKSGLAILARSRLGAHALPADWVSVAAGKVGPARQFPAEFGYNAIRIPLYLSWSADPAAHKQLARFVALWRARPEPAVISAALDASMPMSGAGYGLIAALTLCSADAGEINADLMRRRDPLYYPATLRMLVLIVLQERSPKCL